MEADRATENREKERIYSSNTLKRGAHRACFSIKERERSTRSTKILSSRLVLIEMAFAAVYLDVRGVCSSSRDKRVVAWMSIFHDGRAYGNSR